MLLSFGAGNISEDGKYISQGLRNEFGLVSITLWKTAIAISIFTIATKKPVGFGYPCSSRQHRFLQCEVQQTAKSFSRTYNSNYLYSSE